MDDASLQDRLWQGFARLQAILGGRAAGGEVLDRPGLLASFVPQAPDSPTLNAAIALEDELDARVLEDLGARYEEIGTRRWGVWTDAGHGGVIRTLHERGLRLTSSSPGMGLPLAQLSLNGRA